MKWNEIKIKPFEQACDDHRQATRGGNNISRTGGFLPIITRSNSFRRSQKLGLRCKISKCLRGERGLKNVKNTAQDKPNIPTSHTRVVSGQSSSSCLDTLISFKNFLPRPCAAVSPVEAPCLVPTEVRCESQHQNPSAG